MLVIKNIHVHLGDFQLQNISFSVQPGEYRIIIGPTGTGKTMLLETIAGLHRPRSGTIVLDDQDITRTPPEQRDIGIVYQEYALFPHLTVFENIAFGLVLQKINKKTRAEKVQEMATFLGIEHLLQRSQCHLSGGERQRVALARTLVMRPSVLLLDEPLSAVDSRTRDQLRAVLSRINQQLKLSIIHVTHDLSEAFVLGDTMTVMHRGKILQNGTPKTILKAPLTRLVAELLGMKNFFQATRIDEDFLQIHGLGKVPWASLEKPAWLDHNHQPQKAMKVSHCGMASSQVLRLSDKPAWLDYNHQPQKTMKVSHCGMARSQILQLSDKRVTGRPSHCLISFPDWAVEITPEQNAARYFWQDMTTVTALHSTDKQVLITLQTRENGTIHTSFSHREIQAFPIELRLGISVLTGILGKEVHILSKEQ